MILVRLYLVDKQSDTHLMASLGQWIDQRQPKHTTYVPHQHIHTHKPFSWLFLR